MEGKGEAGREGLRKILSNGSLWEEAKLLHLPY